MVSTRTSQRLFVLGATGGTGLALVQQALERGHNVTAFVRSPQKLGSAREGLSVVKGDPLDADALRAVLPGHDAVISALGPPGPGPTTIAADGARAVVSAMPAAGVRRLLVVGVAVLFEHMGALAWVLRRTFLRNVAADSAEMERMVTGSNLDWTIARPPRLTNGPLTGRYGTAAGQMPPDIAGFMATVSRADVAHFLLDEVEHPAHVRQIVGMAYTKPAAGHLGVARPT
jgi:putative NADH-flavin reductase